MITSHVHEIFREYSLYQLSMIYQISKLCGTNEMEWKHRDLHGNERISMMTPEVVCEGHTRNVQQLASLHHVGDDVFLVGKYDTIKYRDEYFITKISLELLHWAKILGGNSHENNRTFRISFCDLNLSMSVNILRNNSIRIRFYSS